MVAGHPGTRGMLLAVLAAAGCDGARALASQGMDAAVDASVPDTADASSRDKGGAAWPPTADAPFITRLAAVLCDSVATCCTRAGAAHDVLACVAHLEANYPHRYRSGPAPFVVYDPDAAVACLEAVAAHVERCAGPELLWNLPRDPALAVCDRVLQGTRRPGETCSTWQECDSSGGYTTCDSSVCTLNKPPTGFPLPPVLRIGEPCTVKSSLEFCDSDCEPGSFCDRTGHCAAQRASGDCTDICHLSCSPASYCNFGQGLCLPRLPEGSACADWGACQGDNVHCSLNRCAADMLSLCLTTPPP